MKIVKLRRNWFFLTFCILLYGSQAVAQKQDTTVNRPHENISVNKKYDDAGNLIQYDSTYTWQYSSSGDDSIVIQNFYNGFPSFFNEHIGNLPLPNYSRMDSSFMKEFFSNDYFENQFFKQDEQMLKFMQQMDSLKSKFFNESFENDGGVKL